MTWLNGAIDVRDQLPRRTWIIGARTRTSSATWHYNGPAVHPERQRGAGVLDQLRADALWQMRTGWGGTKDGAPHLMYHLVVDADGVIYQTAAEWEIEWHCGHQDGNAHGLAFHLLLGEDQEPTVPQLAALFRATDAARAHYGFGYDRVLGHCEWKHATQCPGRRVMAHLQAYRAHRDPIVLPTPVPAGMRRWRIHPDLPLPARVRAAPGLRAVITGRMKPGTELYIDQEVVGGAVQGNRTWLRMGYVPHEQAALGYVSATLGAWV